MIGGCNMTCPVILTQEDTWFIATDATTGIASQGESLDEALSNLKEALELYYEDHREEVSQTPIFLTTLEVEL